MSEKCYLNGKLLPLADAKVSVFDRGFLFGDGVYEVIPVYRQRRPYFLQRHLKRLQLSLDRISLDFTAESLCEAIFKCIHNCPSETQVVYIQITRGHEPVRQHCPPAVATPTVFIVSRPFPPAMIESVACVSEIDFRWQRGDIKSTSLLAAVLLANTAEKKDVYETMLFRNNNLTEGYKSNYIVVKAGQLLTPFKDNNILSGITCELILELAASNGFVCREASLSYDMIKEADEVLICSTTKGVLPVVRVDDITIGQGQPGAIFHLLNKIWVAYIDQLAENNTYDE